MEKKEIISDESKVASSFSNYFENTILSFGAKANEHSQENYDLKNPVELAIKTFEQHPSINLIDKKITKNENFHFSPVDHENILKEIINLDNKKNGTFKNIPTRQGYCVKDVSDVCSLVLANIWNEEILLNKNFPENLKLADVTPIFKKKDKTFVENYRPVSVIPTVSKIFIRIMQKQLTDYNFSLLFFVDTEKDSVHSMLCYH